MTRQLRFVAQVAFFWLGMSLMRDLLAVVWPQTIAWLESGFGDLLFLAAAMTSLLVLAFPPLPGTYRLPPPLASWRKGP